jgi:hypothetical protein
LGEGTIINNPLFFSVAKKATSGSSAVGPNAQANSQLEGKSRAAEIKDDEIALFQEIAPRSQRIAHELCKFLRIN